MALEIYRARSFRDLKGLAMPKGFETLEKLIAFMLLAYVVGLLVGESRGLELIRLALARFRAIVKGRVPSPI